MSLFSIALKIIGFFVVLALILLIAIVVHKPKPKEKLDDAVGTKTDPSSTPSTSVTSVTATEATPSEDSVRGVLRRRISNAQSPAATDEARKSVLGGSDGGRRPSFRTASPPPAVNGVLPPLSISVNTSDLKKPANAGSPVVDGARRSSLLTRSISPSSNPGTGPDPSSPKTVRKQGSAKGVSFNTDPPSPTTPSSPVVSTLGLPPILFFDDLPSRVDVVESAAFAEDGMLAIGGGPEDVAVRLFNKGTGTIGSLRHTIDIQHDCKKHDGPSVMNFCVDEGKKSTLLLVGTRSERFLLAYKISKSAQTAPLNVFAFETKHGSPLAGVVGFIPKEATSFFDPGVFYATCARGTREVKIWSGKGSSLAVIDCECWTRGLRLGVDGKHIAALSSGGGPGVLLEVKRDKHMHLKFTKSKLVLPIMDAGTMSPQMPSRRSVVGDLALQASQDLVFNTDGPGASLVSCRTDVAVTIAHVADVNTSTQWDTEMLAKPECLLLASPTHITLLVPKAEGRRMHVIVSRGKHVFFFDATLNLIGVLEGRREDGDVLGVALSPKADFVVVVAFGASIARLVAIT